MNVTEIGTTVGGYRRAYFRPAGLKGPHDGCDVEGEHFHDGEFRAYWDALTDDQREEVRMLSRMLEQSLSRTAISLGALLDKEASS